MYVNIKKNTKLKLVIAMSQLILDKGLANTSPQDVLTLSGIGKGSLYHHFSGKEDLAFYAIQYNVEQFIEENQLIFNETVTGKIKLSNFIKKNRNFEKGCFLGQMTRDKLILSTPKLKVEVLRGFSWLKNQLEHVISQCIDEGACFQNTNAAELSNLIISVIQGSYITVTGLDDEKLYPNIMNILENMIFKK